MNRAYSIPAFASLVVAMHGCAAGREAVQDGIHASQKWTHSSGNDAYDRVLAIRSNDFGGRYAQGDPIPVIVEIRNLGSNEAEYDEPAQLFPHLNILIDGHEVKVPLEIENRLLIEKGETWRHEFDLATCAQLEPGSYMIAVGHWNAFVEDLGDWTGTLRSELHEIQIVPRAP